MTDAIYWVIQEEEFSDGTLWIPSGIGTAVAKDGIVASPDAPAS